jgi:hypothetical protein
MAKAHKFTIPSPVNVGARGRIHGDINITYNVPFPTHNCSQGSGAMMGVVEHTEVGFEPNVIREFNAMSAGASAFFSVGMDGHVHQYVPIGKGLYAWAQAAGNREWYSIEFEDRGNPNTPLTHEQIVAFAQLAECLSNYADFPLQITDSVSKKGIGVHHMGGAAWGGHSCPDLPPRSVRSDQRGEVLALAKEIRTKRK